MKRTLILVAACLILISTVMLYAGEKPRIGVLRFTNNTSAYWWSGGVGSELQDMLAAELVATDAFSVLERKELDAVISEQNLGSSGRVDPATAPKLGKILGAKYLVSATVSAFEKDTAKTGGGLSFKGISVGGKKGKAYVAVDLKVIDTTTGAIATARTIEATSKSSGINLGVYKYGVGGNLAKEQKTPVGKAIRACIIHIADYLDCYLTKGPDAPCMEKFDAQEERRREKTKSAIDLD